MKAVFVHRMGPEFASYRYRAMIPAEQVGGTINQGEGQVFIFSKPTPDDLALAKECQAEGVKVVADLGDDHFRHAVWGPIYVELAKCCDALVVPTENMAGRIKKYIGRTVDLIIPDPYEEPPCSAHANGAERILWFGGTHNLKDLTPYRQYLKDLDVTILTGAQHGEPFKFVRWTQTAQTEQLQRANIVFLPVRKGVEFKSANRLVNAIRAGCFVVGDLHPSHREFRDYCWTGNPLTGLKWAYHFRDELDDIVTAGQAYIQKFSPEAIGKLWTQLLTRLCE